MRKRVIRQSDVEKAIADLRRKGLKGKDLALKVSRKLKVRVCDVMSIMYCMWLADNWNNRKEGADNDNTRSYYRVVEISITGVDSGASWEVKRNYLQVENEREYEGIERRKNVIGELT